MNYIKKKKTVVSPYEYYSAIKSKKWSGWIFKTLCWENNSDFSSELTHLNSSHHTCNAHTFKTARKTNLIYWSKADQWSWKAGGGGKVEQERVQGNLLGL